MRRAVSIASVTLLSLCAIIGAGDIAIVWLRTGAAGATAFGVLAVMALCYAISWANR